jgi:hypothetical protein
MTEFVKITVDFVVKGENPEEAKERLGSMMRNTFLPVYNIRPETESTSV